MKTRKNKTKGQKNVEFYFVCFKWQGNPEYSGSGPIRSTIWVGSNGPQESEFHLEVFEVHRHWSQWVCNRTELFEGKYLLTGIISKIKQIDLHQIKLLLLELNLYLHE